MWTLYWVYGLVDRSLKSRFIQPCRRCTGVCAACSRATSARKGRTSAIKDSVSVIALVSARSRRSGRMLLTPGWTAWITFLTGSFLEFPEELPVLAEDGWHGAERRGEVLGQRDLGFHRRITVLGQDSPRRPGRARSAAYFRQQNPDLNGVRYRDLREYLKGGSDAVQVQSSRRDGYQDDGGRQDGRADYPEVPRRSVHDDVLVAGAEIGQPYVHVPGGHADHCEGKRVTLFGGGLAPVHQGALGVTVHGQRAAAPVQHHGEADRRRSLPGPTLCRHER